MRDCSGVEHRERVLHELVEYSSWWTKWLWRISINAFVPYLRTRSRLHRQWRLRVQELADGRSSRSCPSIAPPHAARELAGRFPPTAQDGEVRCCRKGRRMPMAIKEIIFTELIGVKCDAWIRVSSTVTYANIEYTGYLRGRLQYLDLQRVERGFFVRLAARSRCECHECTSSRVSR